MDSGDMTKQRIVFEVTHEGNLSDYKVLNNAFPKREYLSKIDTNFYCFPDFEVKKGEFVVLYFKEGKQRTEKFVDGICHFFYWGLEYANWGNNEAIYILQSANQKKS